MPYMTRLFRLRDAEPKEFREWRSFKLDYERKLLKVSSEIKKVLGNAKTEQALHAVKERLNEYAKLLAPWADKQAEEMVRRVYEANERVWGKYAKRVNFNLRHYVTKGDLAATIEKMKREAAGYIKSLPSESAQRAENIAQEAMMYGLRPEAIEGQVKHLGDITKSRARMIARTEVARANSTLIQARAESVGSEGYIWQTAEDGRVRESHLEMNGKVVYWNDPPTLDNMTGHAGQLPQCRCIPMPLLSDGEINEAIKEQKEREEREHDPAAEIQSQGVTFGEAETFMEIPQPEWTGLNAGIGETDGRSTITAKDPFDIKDSKAIEAAFNKFKKEAADLNIEKAIIISPDGNKYELEGYDKEVGIGLVGEDALKGSKVIHNHTKEYADSFSEDDFVGFFDFEINSLGVAYNGKRHRLEWVGDRLTKNEAEDAYNEARLELEGLSFEAFKKGIDQRPTQYDIMKHLQETLYSKGLRFYEDL